MWALWARQLIAYNPKHALLKPEDIQQADNLTLPGVDCKAYGLET